MNDKENYINLRNRKVYRGGCVIKKEIIKKENKASSIIMNNTDMVFLISDFLGDKSALNFFNTQKSYLKMLEKYPKRYKVKKEIAVEKLEYELDKLNAFICSNSDNLIWVTIIDPTPHFENYFTQFKVIYFQKKVLMGKLGNELAHLEYNNELVEACKNYFESCM